MYFLLPEREADTLRSEPMDPNMTVKSKTHRAYTLDFGLFLFMSSTIELNLNLMYQAWRVIGSVHT